MTTAVRHEVDRRRLLCFLEELDEELGLVDEEEVGYFVGILEETARLSRATSARRGSKSAKRRQVS